MAESAQWISIGALATNLVSGSLGGLIAAWIQARATRASTERSIQSIREGYEKERSDAVADFRRALDTEITRYSADMSRKFSMLLVAAEEGDAAIFAAIFPISPPPIFSRYEFIARLNNDEVDIIDELRMHIETLNVYGEQFASAMPSPSADITQGFREQTETFFALAARAKERFSL